jgi:hypothetical protein
MVYNKIWNTDRKIIDWKPYTIIYLVEMEGELSATGKKSKPTSPLKLNTTMVSTMLSHISVSLSKGKSDPGLFKTRYWSSKL